MAQPDAEQQDVLRFLGDPKTHGGLAVKRIDTHAASVFLAGDTALKVKRAVRFPFLDFSTLAKRKAACEAELAVNAPYAPQIYRRVVAITREADGSLAIAGAGEPVEWAVEMRRFDETRTLDRVAGEIDEALADRLGRIVAAAHARARPVEPADWIASLGGFIDEHTALFRAHAELFAPDEVEALDRLGRAAYARILPLLQARGRHGLVRRIHGDLHLGNIALIEGRPVIFDAIEFSELIASGDVLYDLAFLLMDLLERGCDAAANGVLNRYLTQTRRLEDLDGLAALPFFLSMRAAISAKVAVARMERGGMPHPSTGAGSARAYFAFARKAIEPPPGKLVAVGGLSGTGKTRLARALAPLVPPMPGALVLRSDIERKALFGVGETERLPQQAYAREVTRQVYALLVDKALRAVAAGHSAIVDAVFAGEDERSALEAAARAGNRRLYGLFLVADLSTRLARIGTRTADASDADRGVAEAQERYALGRLEWRRIDASGTVAETVALARAALD